MFKFSAQMQFGKVVKFDPNFFVARNNKEFRFIKSFSFTTQP